MLGAFGIPLSGCAAQTTITAGMHCRKPIGGQGFCRVGVGVRITFGADASSPLSTLSGAYTQFSTTNVTIANGSYSGTIKVYDKNGNVVASRIIDFYVASGIAYLSSPATVQAWAEAHSQASDTVKLSSGNLSYTVTDPDATGGTVKATTYVGNQAVASSTSYFPIGGGITCHTADAGHSRDPNMLCIPHPGPFASRGE